MTRHALLILIFGGIFLAIMGRACAHPAASDAPPSATWAPAWPEPMGRAWLPVTGAAGRAYQGGAWSWVDAAIAHASKPTAAATPTRTGTPTPARPPRATRTQRPTATATQQAMNTVPACGAGTLEPGDGTPHPGCWPYGGTFTPTPTATATRASDTPPASATWEPTPTPRVKATPAAWVAAPETWLYRFPITLVWRRR